MAAGAALASESVTEPLQCLRRPAVDEALIDLRLTGLDQRGKRSVSNLRVHYVSSDKIIRLTVEPAGEQSQTSSFCLECGPTGPPQPCRNGAGVFPGSSKNRIAGTVLPWHVLTDWLCLSFKAEKHDAKSDNEVEVYEILPEGPSGWPENGKRLVYVSRITGEPQRIESYNRRNILTASIQILEVRTTIWGQGIVRSIYMEPETKLRVLIEVVSGSASMPREE